MATNEKRQGETVSTWFKVTLWRKTAEAAAKYLEKGRSVYIEGRLGVEEWTDRDGKERYTLTVNATDMQFIGGANQGGDGSQVPVAAANAVEIDQFVNWEAALGRWAPADGRASR